MLNKLKEAYEAYKPYIRVDLVMYLIMFTSIIIAFIVILLTK